MSTQTLASGKRLEALEAEYQQKLALLEERLAALGAAGEAAAKAAPAGRRGSGIQKKQPEDPSLNEYVEIKLFKDAKDYKSSVFVAVNGENCLIPRGQWFRIRRKFALVLDQSEIQDQRTAELIARESGKFAGSAGGEA